MALLRSGFVLFLSVAVVATVLFWGLLFLGSYGSWPPLNSADDWQPVIHLSVAAFVTSGALMALAWRGRRQPATDGVALLTVLVLAACFVQFVSNVSIGQKFADSEPLFTWAIAGLYLASLVPAYLICYFALSRSPLLRGLAPSRSKRHADACPSDPRVAADL